MNYFQLYLVIGCFWAIISEVGIRHLARIEYGPSVMDIILAIFFWPIQLIAFTLGFFNDN